MPLAPPRCHFRPWSDRHVASGKATQHAKTSQGSVDPLQSWEMYYQSCYWDIRLPLSRLLRCTSTLDLFICELGLRKFRRKRVPHSLLATQKREWPTQSKLWLDLLHQHQETDFKAVPTWDESRFSYAYSARTMFARSRDQVIPCVRSGSVPQNS
jgi:hypothetical protein